MLLCNLSPLAWWKVARQLRHDREQREQARCRASNGFVGPLALRLEAQVGSSFLEGDLHLPALHKLATDLDRVTCLVCAEQSLRSEAVERIADQYPADRHDRQTTVLPDSCR